MRKFLISLRENRRPEEQLNVFDLITIYSIIHRDGKGIYDRSAKRLLEEGIIIRHPVYEYEMGNSYFEYSPFVIKGLIDADTLRRLYYILEEGPKPMSSFVNEWADEYTIKQIRTKIEKLVGTVLSRNGVGRGTTYALVNKG